MKARYLLIVLSIVVIALIAYASLTRDQRNDKRAFEKAKNDSIALAIYAKNDSIRDQRALEERKALEQAFLKEISGVWQESVLGGKVTLDLRGRDKKYDLGHGVYKLTLKKIDLENKTVCFNALYNEDTNPHQMCIRQVFIGSTEFYLIVDDEFYTAPWQLYFIRNLD